MYDYEIALLSTAQTKRVTEQTMFSMSTNPHVACHICVVQLFKVFTQLLLIPPVKVYSPALVP